MGERLVGGAAVYGRGGKGGRVGWRTAAGDASGDALPRRWAATLVQAGSAGISSVTCVVSGGNCWDSGAKV